MTVRRASAEPRDRIAHLCEIGVGQVLDQQSDAHSGEGK